MQKIFYEGGSYRVLSEKEISRIHDTSVRVLGRVGFEIHHPEALELLEKNGAKVDYDLRRAYLPRELISRCIKQAPAEFVFYGREKGRNITIGGKRVHFGTGGLALYVLDLDRNKRPGTIKDVAELARLADQLEYLDFFIVPVHPHDINIDSLDINTKYFSFLHTTKPVMGGIFSRQGLDDSVRIASTIAGGLEKLQRKPFIGFISTITSPLKISAEHAEYIMEVARYRLPLATSTAPAAGATAPITLAGTLVQQNAEALMGIILTQLVNPGTPVLYSAVPLTMDMRTMSFLMGSIESGLMNAAITQMAHFYRLPCYLTVGTTDSKVPDAQAAHEGATTAMLAALAGGNFIHEAFGMLDGAMTASYAQYIIDNDIVGSCLRTLRGIEVNGDTLAYDVIAAVGPGGNYLGEEHTLKYMRTESFAPRASDRQQYKHWIDAGSKDSWMRAEEIAKKILEEPGIKKVPDEVDTVIRSDFPQLVDPDSTGSVLGKTGSG